MAYSSKSCAPPVKRSIAIGNTAMGLRKGGALSINSGDASLFDISDGEGIIVDYWTDVDNPTITTVTWSGLTGNTVTNIATQSVTHVFIDTNGDIVQQVNSPSLTDHRDYIYLGQLGHTNNTTISTALNLPEVAPGIGDQFHDFVDEVGIISIGNYPNANGANLNLDISAGTLSLSGINFHTDPQNPNIKSFSSQSAFTFRLRTQTGNGSTTNTLDVGNYDVAGTITATTGTKYQNFRVFLVASGNIVIQYGQVLYNNMAQALSGVTTESFTQFVNLNENAALVGIITVRNTATDLSDDAQAKFLRVSKFGELVGAAAGTSVSTLQNVYDNSTTPEILTDSTNGAVTIRRGSAADTDNVLETQNNAGTNTFYATGEGTLYLAKNLGIGTTPSYKLHLSDTQTGTSTYQAGLIDINMNPSTGSPFSSTGLYIDYDATQTFSGSITEETAYHNAFKIDLTAATSSSALWTDGDETFIAGSIRLAKSGTVSSTISPMTLYGLDVTVINSTFYSDLDGDTTVTQYGIKSTIQTTGTIVGVDVIRTNYAFHATLSANTGGLTNNYAFYVASCTGGDGNYAFYNATTAPSYSLGNYGFGTTSPDSNLHVSGSAKFSTGPVVYDYSTANRAVYLNASKELVASNATGAELDYLAGTSDIIQDQLDNKQEADFTLTALAAMDASLGIVYQDGALSYTKLSTPLSVTYGGLGSASFTSGYLPYYNGSIFANSLIYYSGSNIGINNTTPQYKLSVGSGNTVTSSGGFGGSNANVLQLISDTTASKYTQLAIQGPTSGGAAVEFYNGSGTAVADFGMNTAGSELAFINRMTSGIFSLYTNNGTALDRRMYISSTGLIGFGSGVTSPTAQVAIHAPTAATKNLVLRASSSQTANILEFQNSSASVLSAFDSSGNLAVGGSSLEATAPTARKFSSFINKSDTWSGQETNGKFVTWLSNSTDETGVSSYASLWARVYKYNAGAITNGAVYGIGGQIETAVGSGAINTIKCLYYVLQPQANVTNTMGIDLYTSIGSGATITDHRGLYIRNIVGSGSVTTLYGIYIEDLTKATTNYAIRAYGGQVVFNENGGNNDFRIEGDTSTHLFFLDASADFIGIGTSTPSTTLDINADKIRLRTAKTPSSASDTGNQGDIAWDSSYFYICIATNTWQRVAHATW